MDVDGGGQPGQGVHIDVMVAELRGGGSGGCAGGGGGRRRGGSCKWKKVSCWLQNANVIKIQEREAELTDSMNQKINKRNVSN